MKKNNALKILLTALMLTSCSKESPELLPCMCDGSESTLGLFDCMCEPFKKKPVRRISYIQDEQQKVRHQTLMINQEQRDAYIYLHQRRDSFAPVKLEYVDFRIRKGRKYDEFDTKLGNYRFRIFGCRRESKNVFLNQGRTMQKDMHFFDIFYEQMNDYYPVVVDKSNPYYLESDRIETPEYVVTAEITDYFMNICDEFDWDSVKQKKLRSGSSEMTVTWRVMDLTRQEVYCKGETTGYGQISEGEPKGETLLVERAFEDALIKLPEISCFNSTLAQRIRPEDLQRQLAFLRDAERQSTSFRSQYDKELKGISLLQECATGLGGQGQTIEGRIVDGQIVSGGADGMVTRGGADGSVTRRGADGAIVRGGVDGNGRYVDKLVIGGEVCDNTIDENSGINDRYGFIECDGGVNETYIDGTLGVVECVDGVKVSYAKDRIGTTECIDGIEDVYVNEKVGVVECDGGVRGAYVNGKIGVIECNGGAEGSYVNNKIGLVECDGGVKGSHLVTRERKERNGRVAALEIDPRCRAIEINDESCTVVKNIKENVTIADDYWIDIPLDTHEPEAVVNRNAVEQSFSDAKNRMCIRNHAPYETLNAQNLYTVRASVVAVVNAKGQKGAGLIIDDNLILTSADLIVKDNNNFDVKTINGKTFKAGAFRVNPNKNVAVLLLETPTQYSPLPLSVELPEVNKDVLMTLGLLDFEKEGEGYLDNNGRVLGYRWSEERGAEIIVDTFVQKVTLGGALIDKNGNIVGISHESKKTADGPDLFIPIETALKSLGLEICGMETRAVKQPVAVKTYETPLADAIDASTEKAPETMVKKERK